MSGGSDGASRPSRAGRPARISRARIVAAARALGPEKLTVQAVADHLHVARSAVNYHVSDRDALLRLVADDIFQSEVRMTAIPVPADWTAMLRDLTHSIREAVIKVGVLLPYFQMPAVARAEVQALEQNIAVLHAAGFSESESARALILVSQLAFASARDLLMTPAEGAHPQIVELDKVLEGLGPGEAPLLRRLVDGWDAASDDQLDFNLAVLTDGLRRRLTARAAAATATDAGPAVPAADG